MFEFRNKISIQLKNLLNNEFIHAVWEGGSAATGYLDEYSDLDLMIICDDEKVEHSFNLLESFLARTYGIKNKFRLPEPTWHGMSQCYYQINNCPSHFFIDVAVVKLTAEDKFLQSDRHGNAVVWFDKCDLAKPEPTPIEVTKNKGMGAYKTATESFFLLPLEVSKLIKRGRTVDAIQDFHNGVLKRLALMLNLKYRPAQFDFGLRYGYRAYPQDIYNKLCKLVINNDLVELEQNLEIAQKWFYELSDELRSEWSQ